MKVYAVFDDARMPLAEVPAYARRVERIGFSGLLVPETVHDGFLAALLALEHTERLHVTTSVVLAFPRSPTIIAYAAWDLQAMSGGRFALGLGSQVKGNIVGRFGVEWAPPVARMRDYVGALRAIWRCWQDGGTLDYESDSYRLDRMQPFFRPDPIDRPEIPILLGGVNPGMMGLAGEVADGLLTHPTNTAPRYLRERVIPCLDEGAARAGRAARPALVASTSVATGPTEDAARAELGAVREYMAFLYSTPHYWPTLELFGWRDTGERLREMVRAGRWSDMAAEIDDAMIEALVPRGTYDEIVPTLERWYGGLTTAITLRMPPDPADDERLADVVRALEQT